MLIESDERNLIINSSAIDLYDDLKKILLNEGNLNYDTLKKYDYVLSGNEKMLFSRLVTDCKNEWEVDKNYYNEDEKKKSICELCGQRGLYKKYKINNIVNGNYLIVGSTCITKFDIKNGEDLKNIRENNIKLFRRTKLDKYINIEKTMRDMNNIFANSPILIPLIYKNQHVGVKHEIEQMYNKIISRSQLEFDEEDIKDIEKLKNILKNKSLLEEQILEYISTSDKDDLMLPKKDLIDDLRMKDIELFNEIEKDGIITWQTGYKIKYVPWLQELIFLLNKKLKKFSLQINEITSNFDYILQYKNFELRIYCNTSNFLAECGGLIFKSNRYIEKDDLVPDINHLIQDYCEIKIDEYNLNSVFNKMYIKLEEFRLDKYFLEYKDGFYYSNKDKAYYQVELKKIMDWYKANILIYESYRDFPKKDFINIISNGTYLDKDDYKDLVKSRDRN